MSFSIQETAEKVGVTTYTLRYYEKEKVIPQIDRNTSGHRVYTEEDVDWINFVTCLKSTGMPISEIRKFTELTRLGDITIDDRIEILAEHKKRLLEKIQKLNRFLGKIDHKIDYHISMKENIENIK